MFSSEGFVEHAKMSKFATEFREIEEHVKLYIINKKAEIMIENTQQENELMLLPVSNPLQIQEQEEIKKNHPTLQITIEEVSQKSIENVTLYWIDKQKIASNLTHKYLIDIQTKQIYDYEGEKINNSIWHTLEKVIKIEEDNNEPPQEPIIHSYDGYPIITKDGIKNNEIKITFDKNRYIDNYYSIDGGKTWQKYVSSFTLAEGMVMAKSVKKFNALEVTVSQKITTPNDILKELAYDNNFNTFISGGDKKCLAIDESAWNKTINIQGYRSAYSTIITVLDVNNKELYRIDPGYGTNFNLDILIPNGAYRLCIQGGDSFTKLKEISIQGLIKFSHEEYYPILTQEGVKNYEIINKIEYPSLDEQKLYKIDESMWGKKLRILSKGYQVLYFRDKDGELLHKFVHRYTDYTHTIPNNTTLLEYYFNENGGIYEMIIVD